MNFDFSDEQQMLRDHARRYLTDASDLSELRRRLEHREQPLHAGLWQGCAEMGWTGAAIDEDFGGLGLSALELCVVSEELGRKLTPVPYFSTVCLAAEIAKSVPPSPLRSDLLGNIAAGQAIVAVGARLSAGGCAWSEVPIRIDHAGLASGHLQPVADLMAATDLLIAGLDEQGESILAWIPANAPGVHREAVPGLDQLRPHGRLHLQAATAQVLLRGQLAEQVLQSVVDQAAVLAAFEQIGVADSALTLARDYSLTRYAFGRPIGANQAVKHRLADMLVRIELARSNAYFGAWASAYAPAQLAQAAAAARLSATEACTFAAEECLHLHGGIGYTWEADCHFYVRRARLLAVSLGPMDGWADQLIATSLSA